jgi:hypothetical protein
VGVVAAEVGDGVLVDPGSEVQAAASAQQATTAPTLTKPRLLSATRSPQSERLDNRRHLANSRSAFQSVGHRLLAPAKGGSAHNKGEPDRTDGNRWPDPKWAWGQSSCPLIRLRRLTVVAESVNQVLSDVLVDPPEVLSAMRMCCQSAWLRTSTVLGGLLIKLC